MKNPKRYITVVVTLFFIAAALPIGVTVWYVNRQISHECQALQLLTVKRVYPPANPAANPSRVQLYQFYEALSYWKDSDGC